MCNLIWYSDNEYDGLSTEWRGLDCMTNMTHMSNWYSKLQEHIGEDIITGHIDQSNLIELKHHEEL